MNVTFAIFDKQYATEIITGLSYKAAYKKCDKLNANICTFRYEVRVSKVAR